MAVLSDVMKLARCFVETSLDVACCSVLQCVVVKCGELQFGGGCCSLQCVAVC
jgi:hypothetical protein